MYIDPFLEHIQNRSIAILARSADTKKSKTRESSLPGGHSFIAPGAPVT